MNDNHRDALVFVLFAMYWSAILLSIIFAGTIWGFFWLGIGFALGCPIWAVYLRK